MSDIETRRGGRTPDNGPRTLARYWARIALAVPMATALAAGSAARGQEPSPTDPAIEKVGAQVVMKSAVTAALVGDRAGNEQVPYRRYQVKKAVGGRLWVASGGVGGWVDPKEVVSFERADDDFSGLIRDHPTAPWAYNRRGLVRYDRRDLDGAIADFSRAIQLDPTLSAYHDNRGAALAAKGESARAIADYDAALRLDANDASAYLGRALVHLDRKDHDRAIADLDEAIKLRPKFTEAFNDRGLARLARGDTDRAIADFNEAIRLDPEDSSARNNRGLARELGGDLQGARDAYDATIKLGPTHVRARANRGRVRAGLGDFAGALADLDEAVRLDPRNVRTLSARARLLATCPLASIRDGKKAVESATLACELSGWHDADALTALAAASAEAGDYAAAKKWQSQALGAIPDGPRKDEARTRLALYLSGKAYHEPAPAPATEH